MPTPAERKRARRLPPRNINVRDSDSSANNDQTTTVHSTQPLPRLEQETLAPERKRSSPRLLKCKLIQCYQCYRTFPTANAKENHRCDERKELSSSDTDTELETGSEDDDLGDEDTESDSDQEYAAVPVRSRTSPNCGMKYNQNGSPRAQFLALNDAIKDVENQENWSQDRRNAWKRRGASPNDFYYRFNASGIAMDTKAQQKLMIETKSGKWTAAEHKLFMERALEFGVTKWGLFSKKIPGRAGYTCAAHWRTLIEKGDVTDHCHYINDDGNLRYKWATKKNDSTLKRLRRYSFVVHKDPSGTFQPGQMHPRHVHHLGALEKQYRDKWRPAYAKHVKGTLKRKNSKDNDSESEMPPKKKRRMCRKS